MSGVKVTIQGERELRAVMKGLPVAVQNRALRRAVQEVVRRGAKAMKAATPRRRKKPVGSYKGGQSRKAVGSKVKQYKKKIVGIIGIRAGFEKQIGTITKGKRKGQPIIHDPFRVAHFVEKAHKITGPTEAVVKSEGPGIIAESVKRTVEREWAKARKG